MEKDNKTKMIAVIAAVVLVAGGVTGGVAWHGHRQAAQAEQQLEAARATCSVSLKDAKTARTAWLKLVDGDAQTLAKTDRAQVKDAETLDTLAVELKAKAPAIAACAGDTADQVGRATERIGRQAAWYASHTKSLEQAAEAVRASVTDKTVADAQALYDSTAGKVADEATRTALKEAIGRRDTKAIADATGKVNASVKAKADAAAKAAAEAAARAAAQAQAQSGSGSSGSASRRSSGSSGSTGTARRSTGSTGSSYSRSSGSTSSAGRSGGSTGSTGGQTGQQSSGESGYGTSRWTNSMQGDEFCAAGDTSGNSAVLVPCN